MSFKWPWNRFRKDPVKEVEQELEYNRVMEEMKFLVAEVESKIRKSHQYAGRHHGADR